MAKSDAVPDSIRLLDHERVRGPYPRVLPSSFRPQGTSRLDPDSLISLLNLLLECECAGAKGAILCRDQAQGAVPDSVLFAIGRDEGRFCGMLTRHIERLGGTASRETGALYQRLCAIPDQSERLVLLNGAQRWVVRTLDEALPAIRHPGLEADLREMRDAHARNMGLCHALIARRQPGKIVDASAACAGRSD